MEHGWTWETVDTRASHASGNLGQLFKNEHVAQPGILAESAPSAAETLVAREVIQNSWDSARERAEADRAVPFQLRFQFVRLTGSERELFIRTSHLRELKSRADEVGHADLKLASENILQTPMADEDPVNVLLISEQGTTGLYGNFDSSRSKMYRAMAMVGGSAKTGSAGGSYGYGKAGMIRASRTRTVMAYTCHHDREDERGVTRKFLGMAYWESHSFGEQDFTGFGRLGNASERGTRPAVNELADELAGALGVSIRNPGDPGDIGTTFVVVDPDVEAEGLRKAVERNWWPAMVRFGHEFDIEIIDYNGDVHFPRMRGDAVVASFVRAYEVATMPQDAAVSTERKADITSPGVRGRKVGQFGATSDPAGWSFAELNPDHSAEHCSLVALIREPHMVVKYEVPKRQKPHVRGVFVADPSVDSQLRETEPKAHDDWATSADADEVSPEAVNLAKSIKNAIRREVGALQRELQPPTPPRNEIRLPLFEKLARGLLEDGGSRPSRPPEGAPRQVSISIDARPCLVENGVALEADIGLALAPRVQSGKATGQCKMRLRVVEGEERGRDSIALEITSPPGQFDVEYAKDGSLIVRGPLTHDLLTLRLASAPYEEDWTVDLEVDAALLEEVE